MKLIALAAAAVFTVAAVVSGDFIYATALRLATRWVAPAEAGQGPDEAAETEAAARLGERVTGRLVWSSNRAGNHELYMLELPAGTVRRLTDDPAVDFAARFSPDGRALVFARSRREWVSFRERDGWNVWLLDLDTGEERVLARRAYHPTWGPEGTSVLYERGLQVVELDLATGEERVLFDAERALESRGFGDAELRADRGRLALSVKDFGALVTEPNADDYLRLTDGQVCQTTWVPGTDELLWMVAEGNGGTRVMRGASDGSSSEVFMDLPGERSHEYFPHLTDDGRWLVWGAAAEGHEHDRADYEIYAWEVGTPWESAIRLTYFPGNDQWPDLHLDS